MEADNVNNTVVEIRNKELMRRRSKSRSMTPVFGPALISEDVDEHVRNDIGLPSSRLASARKSAVTSSRARSSTSKSKTVTGTVSNTVVVTESSSSRQESRTLPAPKAVPEADESVSHSVTKNDSRPMELRSERQLVSRHKHRSVANGAGKEDKGKTTSNSVTATRAANKSTVHQSRTVPLKTSDYSSDDDEDDSVRDSQNQRVLNVYQGEFWNELPKTDFTYSPMSKDYYREVAPGVTTKPNMSRSSYQSRSSAGARLLAPPVSYSTPTRELHSTTTTTTSSVTTGRRSRFYDAKRGGSKAPLSVINTYGSLDSDEDEVETHVQAKFAATAVRSPVIVTYFTSFFSTIWTMITTTWTTTVETTKHVLGLQTDGVRGGYSTPVRSRREGEEKLSWWRRMLGFLYVLPALVTGADLALLSTTSSRDKRLKLFFGLLLLLLLLLAGWFLYALVPEETVSQSSVLLDKTQTAIGDWFGMFGGWLGTLGGWFRQFGGWILLLFTDREMHQKDHLRSAPVEEFETHGVPPLTAATSPLPATAPTPYDVDAVVERLLASGRFQLFLDSRLGEVLVTLHERETDVETLTRRVLASEQFLRAKVDVDSLAADVWKSGRLQPFLDAYLRERKEMWDLSRAEQEAQTRNREALNIEFLKTTLMQELNEKNQYFEVRNTQLVGEVEQLKKDIEKKLNLSMAEFKSKLNEELGELKRAQDEEIRLLKMQLKKCCDKATPALGQEDVEEYVLRYMAGLYGLADGESVGHAEMRALIAAGKQQFEAALANVTAHHKAEMKEVSQQSSQLLMDTISERISEELASHLAMAATSSFPRADGESPTVLVGGADGRILEIVNKAIMTYDADKTGKVDYALESSGGSIINTRCTESYYKHSASMSLLGIPYWYSSNTPRTVIQPEVHPGECWAFRGAQGFLVIQLAGLVRISSFSLEHIPRALALNGNIDSAPRDFSVWGLEKENDPDPTELGRYTYLKNSTSLQYFIVKRSDVQPFRIIELRIETNHGNLEYTCLYRFRVHGSWVSY